MRSYGQYCALARALDVVGERWTLLIIRELFARDSRYSDLRDALPGIATNLLADRLRHLQDNGVIETYEAPAPVRATVYRLTERGRALGPALAGLVRWGSPLVSTQGNDEFRTRWLVLGLRVMFDGVDVSDLAPLEVVILSGDEPATLIAGQDGVTVETGGQPSPEKVVVSGRPDEVNALLAGSLDPLGTHGLTIDGPAEALGRLAALARRSRR